MSYRLAQCVKAPVMHENGSANEILGGMDAMKLKPSMTLFHLATRGEEAVFKKVLEPVLWWVALPYTAGKISTG